MDGVVAGVVAIAALALVGLCGGAGEVTVLALCLAGACCGFLVYNFHPARIFMGDCGSFFLGFSIAALSLMAGVRSEGSGLAALVGPAAVLAIPIFDTALVIVARRRRGLPVMQGGRDHTSHRLAALGISERGVALLLYAVGTALAAVTLIVVRLPTPAVAVLGVAGIAALGLLGLLLLKVPVDATPTEGGIAVGTWQARRRPAPAQPPPHGHALQEPST
jgi:UDP-GlcNAc:undecaprenyl-phosphate GlcNAc-1-phosphate transferase